MQMTWEQTVQGWDSQAREAVNSTVQRYGPPDEMGERRLTWYERGPWHHISVYRDKAPHKFPKAHNDLLEQTIRYQVPPERFDELAQFDGSVWAERTKGLLHARCDKEEMNILAINLAHEIATGMRTVDDARQFYTETAGKFMMGTPTEYTQRLMFEPPTGDVGDPDETTAPM